MGDSARHSGEIAKVPDDSKPRKPFEKSRVFGWRKKSTSLENFGEVVDEIATGEFVEILPQAPNVENILESAIAPRETIEISECSEDQIPDSVVSQGSDLCQGGICERTKWCCVGINLQHALRASSGRSDFEIDIDSGTTFGNHSGNGFNLQQLGHC
eukprot:c20813_g1_i2.p3 GENE.c20813_g1_i2~~c20813_g1_i2.p3  ORF type:complete len:157 (+),score=39.98 c20813_g1_i2:450-920(+)